MNIKGVFSKLVFWKKSSSEWPIKAASEAPTEVATVVSPNQDFIDELNSIKIGHDHLMIDKMDSEAEAIKSYLSLLAKDISIYHDFKKDKDKHEQAICGIYSKIKQITVHGLELRNLLSSLEDLYFNPAISILKRVNDRLHKASFEAMIENLEKDLELVKDLELQLGKMIVYDELFNPDKNPDYRESISKELSKHVLNTDINDLVSKILNVVIDKSVSVKVRIEHDNAIEKAKFML